jgi:hypothetical protein
VENVERRRTGRHNVTFKAVCDGEASYSTVTILDVSEHGAFIQTESPLPEGSRVSLSPLGNAAEVFELPATVVRVVDGVFPAGMGVRFAQVDEDDLVALRRLFGELPRTDPRAEDEGPARTIYGAPIRAKVRTLARIYAQIGAPRGWLGLRS